MSRLAFIKKSKQGQCFILIEMMFRFAITSSSSYGSFIIVVVDSLMELQCKMVLSNHFGSSVLVTLIFSQSLTKPCRSHSRA